MRDFACALCVLAACGQGGVVIIVDPAMGMNVDEVRLYIGHGDRAMVSRLETNQGGVSNAPYWTRDVGNELDVAKPDAANGPVGFTLVRGDAATTIPIVIAVGFSAGKVVGEGVRADIPIPGGHDFVAYHVGLHGPVSTLDVPSNREVGLWSPPGGSQDADAQACIGVAIDTGTTQTRAFVVADNDQDCDGIPSDDPSECDPNTYLADRPANRDEISCLAAVQPNCYLGGPHCKDGAPQGTTCRQTTYCMPTTVCSACTGSAAADLTCATDAPRIMAATGYHCTLTIDASSGEACETALVLERPPTGGFACTAAAIRNATSRFDDQVDLGTLQVDVNLDPSCAVTVMPHNKVPMSAQTALVAFDLENGHGLGVPLTFTAGPPMACSTVKATCTLDSPAFAPALTQCMAGWQPPTQVPIQSGGLPTSDPSLTDDMLEMYYVAEGDIVVATRPDAFAPWTTGTVVTELSSALTERAPNVSPDGLTMLFTSDRLGGLFQLYTSTRATTAMSWSPPQPVALQITGSVLEATADETLTHVVVAVDVVGSMTGPDLFEFVRTVPNGPFTFGPAIPFNSPSNDITPHLSPNGLHLYFATDTNDTANRHLELYVASRNAITDPFGTPVWLAELGSAELDDAPWVSRDGHTIYFTSDRDGVANVFTATR